MCNLRAFLRIKTVFANPKVKHYQYHELYKLIMNFSVNTAPVIYAGHREVLFFQRHEKHGYLQPYGKWYLFQ